MEKEIKDFLVKLEHPYLKINFIDEKSITNININKDSIDIDLEFNFHDQENLEKIKNEINKFLKEQYSKTSNIKILTKIKNHKVQSNLSPMKGIKNIIAIASGKGGVGKSSVSVNLAIALSKLGSKVGILDADIYGPSQPTMLGVNKKPDSLDGKSMEPINIDGIQVMSIGFLVDQETPMIWRGPMVTGTLEQLLKETNWSELDYLIIDLPPGTGDIQLTLAQKIPLTGAIIVSTPQDIALLDAKRGLKMFEKVKVPILGIIENMSTHICSNCGHEEHIFGEDGGVKMAKENNVELIGVLPLNIVIREKLDKGKAFELHENSNKKIAENFYSIALKTAFNISKLNVDHQSKFPKIVIEKN